MTLRVVVADDQALVRAGFCGIVGATEGFTVVGEASTGAEAVAEARRARPDVVLMDVRMPVMDGIEATRQITGPDGAAGTRVLILTTFDLDEFVYSALRAGASGFLLQSTQPADLIAAIRVVAAARRTRPDVVLMDVRMPDMDGIEATRQITGPDGAAGTRVLILTTFDLDEYVYSALRAGASGFLLKSTLPADLIAAIKVVAAGDALLAPTVTRRLVAEFVRRPAPPAPATLAAITAREREVLALIATGMSNTEIADRLAISAATTKTHVSHLLAKLNARDRVHLVILAYQAGLGPPG